MDCLERDQMVGLGVQVFFLCYIILWHIRFTFLKEFYHLTIYLLRHCLNLNITAIKDADSDDCIDNDGNKGTGCIWGGKFNDNPYNECGNWCQKGIT